MLKVLKTSRKSVYILLPIMAGLFHFASFHHLQSDLEKVFNVPRILNLPFSNVPQIIKFGSKVRRNNEKFDRALRVSV